MNLASLQSDPSLFRRTVRIPSAGGSVVPFGQVCEAWQDEDFRAMDGAWQSVVHGGAYTGPRRAWLERPRGHDKSSGLALMVCWALFASRKRIAGVAVAADQDQARILRDCISNIVAVNPWLAQVLDIQQWRVVNKVTASELRILASDVATSWGLLVDFIVADEVAHWAKRELFDSLLSTAAKKPACLLVCISNSGFTESWQWEVREKIRTDPRWHFSRLDGPRASWITADALAEQERLLPRVAYERLWLNQWSEGAGDALEPQLIDAAIRLGSPPAYEPGCVYIGGLDLSLSRDASAFVVVSKSLGWQEEKQSTRQVSRTVGLLEDLGFLDPPSDATESVYHAGDGRLRLCHVAVWRPNRGRIDLDAIEKHIRQVHSRLPLTQVVADIYQAAMLCQRLQRQGIAANGVHLVPSILQDMASATLDAFRDKTLDLYPQADLVADLKSLRVREYRDGRAFRLESPRKAEGEAGTRHGDTASALGLSLYGARFAQPTSAAHLGSLVYN